MVVSSFRCYSVARVALRCNLALAHLLREVPGGVGPMTIAMLLQNTLRLAQRAAGVPTTVRAALR